MWPAERSFVETIRLRGFAVCWFVLSSLVSQGCNQPKAGNGAPPHADEGNQLEAVGHSGNDGLEVDQEPIATERARSPEPPPPVIPGVRTHVVQRGETLWGLSQKYYGSGKEWSRIYTANRNRIQDPKDLPAGTKLIIP